MGTHTFKIVALALAGLLLPSLVWAAGLGRLTVFSALGEPLRAEIEVSSVEPGEADSLSVRVAGAEAYRQANIERQGALASIRFAVDRRQIGRYVVVMTSAEPINEPFLDILVELSWASGRLVREYTFLLDPPEYKAPALAAPAAVEPIAPVAQPLPAAKAEVSAPAAVVERELAPALAAKPAATYEVKRGDTLAKIAIQNKAPSVTLQQMLVALYRGNQDVFDGNNMNRLRAGKILNLPEHEAAASVSQEDARRIVAAQSSEYAEYRRRIGAAVAEAPARVERGRQVAGRIGAPREAAPPAEPAKDQLRLSKAEDTKAAGRVGAAARADDLAAKDKALKEASERIAMLEQNVRDLQKLAQLKSEAGAQLQQAAKGAAAKAAPEPAAKAAPAAKPDAAKVAAAEPAPKAPEPAKAAPAPAPAAKGEEAAKAPAKAAEAPKAPEAAKAVPKAAPKAAAAPPPPEPSFVDELLDNTLALGAAGGVVVLLAGYAAYAWRRKRKSQLDASLMGAAVSPSVFGATGAKQIDTGAASVPGDVGKGAISKVEAEEIDPIAEADVYMAYGRDAQAEEILKEALGKDSSRHAIRAKLLEIYANRKDLKAFGTVASDFHAATGGQGPEWGNAVSLGLSIDPQNPLYGGAPAQQGAQSADDTQILTQAEITAAAAPLEVEIDSAAQAASPLDFDLDLGGTSTQAPADLDLDVTVTAPAEAPTTLDFDLGFGGGPAAAPAKAEAAAGPAGEAPKSETAAEDTGISIDFDLGPTAAEAAPAPAAQPPAAPAADSALVLDFDLGGTSEVKPAEEKPLEVDLSAISLDLGTAPDAAAGAPAPDAHWQEVATKLDLAKAYEEMGDKDGARELLNEVMNEGDAAQKQKAKVLFDSLG